MEKRKILIVDDDANIAELIALYLTKECFPVSYTHLCKAHNPPGHIRPRR